jgi:hypothetical protein
MAHRRLRFCVAVILGGLLGLSSLWSAGLHAKWLVEAVRGQLTPDQMERQEFLGW